MKQLLEAVALFLDFGVLGAAVMLAPVVSGSVFAAIPKYITVLALSLIVHSAIGAFLTGRYAFFVYGLSALIVSICYLLLVYGVFSVLRNISKSGGER